MMRAWHHHKLIEMAIDHDFLRGDNLLFIKWRLFDLDLARDPSIAAFDIRFFPSQVVSRLLIIIWILKFRYQGKLLFKLLFSGPFIEWIELWIANLDPLFQNIRLVYADRLYLFFDDFLGFSVGCIKALEGVTVGCIVTLNYADWTLTDLSLHLVIIVRQFVKGTEAFLVVDFSLLLACFFEGPITSPFVIF